MSRVCWLIFAAAALVAQTRDVTLRKIAPTAMTDFDMHVKVALVVGVGSYAEGSGLGPLKYAARDAEVLASALKNQGYLVRLLTDSQATRSMIRRSIREMADAVENDQGTFLFFFGGHGFTFKNQNYLAPYGVTIDDLEGDGFAINDLESLLATSKAKRKLVFIDACRNDPGEGSRGVEQRSFAKLNAAEGLKIMFSTKEGRLSYEDDRLQQGIFTYFLVRALNGEAAGPDGLVTFRDMSDFVTEKMRAYTVERGQVQVPFEAGESSGDFLLAKSLKDASVRQPFTFAGGLMKAPPLKGRIVSNPKDGLNYAFIPTGTFLMGCSEGDNECALQERPPHRATIANGYWIGQLETTVAAYKKFSASTNHQMPAEPRLAASSWNPGYKIDNLPITNVTWHDAKAYCEWAGLRLPSESEWEFAARGESAQARYGSLDEIAWYAENSGNEPFAAAAIMKEAPKQYLRKLAANGASPKPGGLKKPNAYGLFDMLGNVREWTADEWTGLTAQESNEEATATEGKLRVTRGGSYAVQASGVRVSVRGHFAETERNSATGFRCAGDASSLSPR